MGERSEGRVAEHSVVDGVLKSVSPSQISTFTACRRQWYFDKVLRLPRKPPTASQLEGTAIHAQLEHYLGTGENVLGRVARAGLDLLPEPGPDLLLEVPIHHVHPKGEKCACTFAYPKIWAAGVPLIGFVDLVVPRTLPEGILVLDHKTTTSIDKYSKTSDQLLKDPQCASYLRWAQSKWPSIEEFTFGHIYYQTKGAPLAAERRVTVSHAMLGEMFGRLEETVEEMKKTAALASVEEVQSSPFRCGDYGGCMYSSNCSASPSRRFVQSMGVPNSKAGRTTTMGLMDRLKKKAAETEASMVDAAEVEDSVHQVRVSKTPAAKMAAAASRVAEVDALERAKTKAMQAEALLKKAEAAEEAARAAAEAAEDAVEEEVTGIPVSKCVEGDLYRLSAGQGKPPLTEEFVGVYAGKASKWYLFTAGEEVVRLLENDLVFLVSDADDSAAPAKVSPNQTSLFARKAVGEAGVVSSVKQGKMVAQALKDAEGNDIDLGHVTFAEIVPPDAPPATNPEATVPVTVAVEAPKKKKAKAEPNLSLTPTSSPRASELVLYVDCVPSTPYRDLASWVGDLAARIAQEAGQCDLRVADAGALAFGKWKGVLSTLAGSEAPTGSCVLFSGDLSDPVIEALAAKASCVVRGRR